MWIDIKDLPRYKQDLLFKFKKGAVGLGFSYGDRITVYSNGGMEDIYIDSERFQDIDGFCYLENVLRVNEAAMLWNENPTNSALQWNIRYAVQNLNKIENK